MQSNIFTSEVFTYIFVLTCTFYLFYTLIKKYGIGLILLKNIFYASIIIYVLTLMFPEIKFIFVIPYFVYYNIFNFIKTGDILPFGCIKDSNGSIICM